MNSQNQKDQDQDLSIREEFQVHLSRGREALESNNLVEAKDELESALDLEPGSEQAQNLLAMVFFKLEEYSRAIRMFRSLVAKNPKVSSLHINLGLAYLKKDDYRRAIDSLRKVIELDADHRGAHNYLGLAYSKLGEYQNAKDEFELAGAMKMSKKMDDLLHQQAPEKPRPVKDQETIRGEQKILESQLSEVVDLPEDIDRIRPPEPPPPPEPPQAPEPPPPPEPVPTPAPPPAPEAEPAAEAEEEIEGYKLAQEEGTYSTFTIDEPPPPETKISAPEPAVPESQPPAPPEPVKPEPAEVEEKAETVRIERMEAPVRIETSPVAPEKPHPKTEPEIPAEPPAATAAAPAVEVQEAPQVETRAPRPEPEIMAAPEGPEEGMGPVPEAEELPATQFSTVEMPDKGVFLEFSQIGADTAIRLGKNSYAISQKDKSALVRFQALSGCMGGYQIELKHKRFKGKETRLVFGGEKDPVVEFKGAGVLLISAPEGDTFNLDPQGGILYISEAFLLAAQGDLQWENGKVPLKDFGELNLVRLQGNGYVLVSLPGKLHAISLQEGDNFSMLPPMLVGWMGNLVPLVKDIILNAEEGKEKEKGKGKEKEKEEIKRVLLEMRGAGKVFFYLPTP